MCIRDRLSYHWTEFKSVAEEILISELLQRNFLAITSIKYGHNADVIAVTNTLFREHKSFGAKVESFFELIPQRIGTKFKNNLINLAQTVKCSNDFLLGHLTNGNALNFAFDKELVTDVATGAASHSIDTLDKIKIHIGKETISELKTRTGEVAFSPDLNKQWTSCIKNCFTTKTPAMA